MKIGYVKSLKVQPNTVIVLLHIHSVNILIPKSTIIEANQVGLFNDAVVDITPLKLVDSSTIKSVDVLSKECIKSLFLCSDFYLKGYRGLNYDDLIRATTRISQRFDDPRFFYLLYLFLQNSYYISDEIFFLVNNGSSLLYLFIELVKLVLFKYLY